MNEFSNWYEKEADDIEKTCNIDSNLRKTLSDKRAFGLNKYKEVSFQISEENSLNVDIKKHAEEELEDFINYMTHMAVVRKLNGCYNMSSEIYNMITEAESLYRRIRKVELK